MSTQNIPIPERFYSSADKIPFTHCLDCKRNLMAEPHVPYMIEKAYKRYVELDTEEVIFEFAICIDCQQRQSEGLSKDSLANIREYFSTHLDPERIKQAAEIEEDERVEFMLKNCILLDKEIDACTEYSLYAYCAGGEMQLSIFPFAVSGVAMDEMSELLSAKSRGEMDDFLGKHFTGPPELNDILKPKPVIIL